MRRAKVRMPGGPARESQRGGSGQQEVELRPDVLGDEVEAVEHVLSGHTQLVEADGFEEQSHEARRTVHPSPEPIVRSPRRLQERAESAQLRTDQLVVDPAPGIQVVRRVPAHLHELRRLLPAHDVVEQQGRDHVTHEELTLHAWDERLQELRQELPALLGCAVR